MFKKFLLGLLLALATISAQADWAFAKDELAIVARKDVPCSERLLKLVKLAEPPAGLKWQKAEVTFEGKLYDACWAPYQSMVLIVDESGEGGAIPQSLFKLLKDV
jgi:hypothetical protein